MNMQKDTEHLESKILHRFGEFAGARVLEAGCGEGRLTWQYAGAARSTFAFDPDFDALRVARADQPSDLHAKVHFLRAEAEHIPFVNESFDRAVLAWSF